MSRLQQVPVGLTNRLAFADRAKSCSDRRFRFVEADQPCRRDVALRYVSELVHAVELLLLRKVGSNGLVELDAPHRGGVQPNEGSIPLLAFAEGVVRLL